MRLLDCQTSPVRVKADFNVAHGDLMWAVLMRGFDPIAADLRVGDPVDLYDEDGLSCWGRVVERKGKSLDVLMLWETLRDPVKVHWTAS